jgi:peptidoglycan/LPS O-acetylase OafA/YrhL
MERTTVEPAGSRLAGVDVLRGLSITAVVLLHSKIRLFLAHVPVGFDLPALPHCSCSFWGSSACCTCSMRPNAASRPNRRRYRAPRARR